MSVPGAVATGSGGLLVPNEPLDPVASTTPRALRAWGPRSAPGTDTNWFRGQPKDYFCSKARELEINSSAGGITGAVLGLLSTVKGNHGGENAFKIYAWSKADVLVGL